MISVFFFFLWGMFYRVGVEYLRRLAGRWVTSAGVPKSCGGLLVSGVIRYLLGVGGCRVANIILIY